MNSVDLPMTIAALFAFIASPAVVGGVTSFLFEKLQVMIDTDPRAKFLIIAVTTMVLTLLSQGLMRYIPGEFIAGFDPVYGQFMSLLIAVYAGQATHATFNKSKPPVVITVEHEPEEEIPEANGELG